MISCLGAQLHAGSGTSAGNVRGAAAKADDSCRPRRAAIYIDLLAAFHRVCIQQIICCSAVVRVLPAAYVQAIHQASL